MKQGNLIWLISFLICVYFYCVPFQTWGPFSANQVYVSLFVSFFVWLALALSDPERYYSLFDFFAFVILGFCLFAFLFLVFDVQPKNVLPTLQPKFW